ncbi:hypothetical protein [Pararhodobacter sp. SW119]|uniref:hypothetical protein n=1 Tax=Pararhodobacter sp. SW119 TaxID=2780075 RepID=UPI001ADF3D29|nr:hypothetical protein [Pararhodobacter sp. SW119]
MTDEWRDRAFNLELQIQKLEGEQREGIRSLEASQKRIEDKLSGIRYLALGTIAFLGLGSGLAVYQAYSNIASEIEEQVRALGADAINENVERTTELRAQAEIDAQTIRAQLRQACHDPRWVDDVGFCIFNVLPERRYTLNYGAAVAMCAARGARLCRLEEVQQAFERGAEWCAWGWIAEVVRGQSVTDISGTIVYPWQQAETSGCAQGMNIRTGQDIIRGNWGATCCL